MGCMTLTSFFRPDGTLLLHLLHAADGAAPAAHVQVDHQLFLPSPFSLFVTSESPLSQFSILVGFQHKEPRRVGPLDDDAKLLHMKLPLT